MKIAPEGLGTTDRALMAFDSLLEKRMRRNCEAMLPAIKTAVEEARD